MVGAQCGSPSKLETAKLPVVVGASFVAGTRYVQSHRIFGVILTGRRIGPYPYTRPFIPS